VGRNTNIGIAVDFSYDDRKQGTSHMCALPSVALGIVQPEILSHCQRLDEAKPPAFFPQNNNRQAVYLKSILLKKILIGK